MVAIMRHADAVRINPLHREVPQPAPVPPPFRTWDEYRAAMAIAKNNLMKEQKMSPSALNEAVYREESEELQRERWTEQSKMSTAAKKIVAGLLEVQIERDQTTPQVTRADILKEAEALVNGARNQTYDAPEQNFARIARHWRVFFENRFDLCIDITCSDVALLMDLMKTARLEFNPKHRDSWVDKAGYTACGAECVLNDHTE